MSRYTIGLDFGTNSVRALLVDVADGGEATTAVFDYPSGNAGVLEDSNEPNLARQNPQDYVEGLIAVLTQMASAVDPAEIIGIGVDTTGSSPIPVDAQNVPLAMQPEWADNLAAQCWLWKDHTAFAEATEITEMARQRGEPYLAKCGGTYSSEWFWSKILHCARTAPEVFAAAYSWVELADWVPGYLAGKTRPEDIVRGVCAAGHKAMYAAEWGGLPSKDFLAALDPRLAGLRTRLFTSASCADTRAGELCADLAASTGLKKGIPIAVGAFDAHFGAVGAGIQAGTLVKIIGTSTCDCLVHSLGHPLPDIPGLCGIVPGSILPGHYGLEAGQSAVGDTFNWFVRFSGQSHEELTEEASKLSPGQSGLLALDWHNGNRTVLVDPLLTGLIVGQTLHTTPAEAYRALVEATAFGSLKIIDRLEEYGVKVEEVVACGGIAEKNPFVMQIYADVLGRPMKVSRSSQTCALGSAIFASVVAGAHSSVRVAQAVMTGTKDDVFEPVPQASGVYRRLYALYGRLHDAFGVANSEVPLGGLMKELLAIKREARDG